MKNKLNAKTSSFFSFFTLLFVLLLVFSLQGTLTGRAVFVLDDDVTADQIATIATLAGPGDETKMLSEVSLDAGGYIIFSGLDDGDTAIIKENNGNIYVKGNVEDAISVIKNSDYKQLLEESGTLEIVNGEIVVEEEPVVEEVVEEEVVEEEVVEEEVVEEETRSLNTCEETKTGVTGTYNGYSFSQDSSCESRSTYDSSTGTYIYESYMTLAICNEDGTPGWKTEYCQEGEICDSGTCESIKTSQTGCEDSDFTTDMNRYGEVTFTAADGSQQVFSDKCFDQNGASWLYEQYCTTDKKTGAQIAATAEYICNSGCTDGACISYEESCKDSDDGQDSFTYGTVTTIDHAAQKDTSYDTCGWSSETGVQYVQEYYCDGLNAKSQNIDCSYECSQGKCLAEEDYIEYTCSDGDSGRDPNMYGALSLLSSTGEYQDYGDYCVDTNTVMEYLCGGEFDLNPYAAVEIDCSGTCYNGECVAAFSVDEFFTSTQDWYYDMKIVIPSKGSTSDYLAALALVGKYGYPLVKDTEISDWRTMHAIVVGGPSVNSVSKAVIDAGASQEGAYYVYQDPTYYGTVLVVGSDDPKETRKAVKELVKK